MIDGSTLPPGEPIFTFVGEDGVNVHIHAERLRQHINGMDASARPEIFNTVVDMSRARRYITEDNSVSIERVKELWLRKKPLDPIIYCKDGCFTNGAPDVFLADGHHRYVLAALLKQPTILAYVLEESFWRPFQIKNLPVFSRDLLRAIPIRKRNY